MDCKKGDVSLFASWYPTPHFVCSVRQLPLCFETQWERGKASLNVGCCVIPPRAPLLFLCLGPHVTVGYFLWWLARINRSSNVHPVSQQLHDWWDFTLLIYFIIVAPTWGEWRNGLCSMRNVTCDCRYGTGDYSNVRFVWGLYLISECQLLYEPRIFFPWDRVLYVILITVRAVDWFCMLCCC